MPAPSSGPLLTYVNSAETGLQMPKVLRNGNEFKMSYDGKIPYKSGSVYNELRLTGGLSDAVLKVHNDEFLIHKIILCNCSPYFE